jgi:hypothetical protein
VNTGVLWPMAEEAEARVLRIQSKLHQWATQDRGRRLVDWLCQPELAPEFSWCLAPPGGGCWG